MGWGWHVHSRVAQCLPSAVPTRGRINQPLTAPDVGQAGYRKFHDGQVPRLINQHGHTRVKRPPQARRFKMEDTFNGRSKIGHRYTEIDIKGLNSIQAVRSCVSPGNILYLFIF